MLGERIKLFPAHAGVILISSLEYRKKLTFPRTRGGDPPNWFTTRTPTLFSPHTRG